MIRNHQKPFAEEFSRLLRWYGIPYLETIVLDEIVQHKHSQKVVEQFVTNNNNYDANEVITELIMRYANDILTYAMQSNAIKICPMCGCFQYTIYMRVVNKEYVCAKFCAKYF